MSLPVPPSQRGCQGYDKCLLLGSSRVPQIKSTSPIRNSPFTHPDSVKYVEYHTLVGTILSKMYDYLHPNPKRMFKKQEEGEMQF